MNKIEAALQHRSPVDRLLNRFKIQIAAQIREYLRTPLPGAPTNQKELATAAGLRPSFVSRVLSGDSNLTLETLAKIQHALKREIIVIPKAYNKRLARQSDEAAKSLIRLLDEQPTVSFDAEKQDADLSLDGGQRTYIIQVKETPRPATGKDADDDNEYPERRYALAA